EPDVDDDVLAHLGVGYVLHADVLLYAAEVDLRHQCSVAVLNAEDLPRYRQTHRRLPSLSIPVGTSPNSPPTVGQEQCRRRWAARDDASSRRIPCGAVRAARVAAEVRSGRPRPT